MSVELEVGKHYQSNHTNTYKCISAYKDKFIVVKTDADKIEEVYLVHENGVFCCNDLSRLTKEYEPEIWDGPGYYKLSNDSEFWSPGLNLDGLIVLLFDKKYLLYHKNGKPLDIRHNKIICKVGEKEC